MSSEGHPCVHIFKERKIKRRKNPRAREAHGVVEEEPRRYGVTIAAKANGNKHQ